MALLWLAVIGPLLVRDGDRQIAIAAGKQRVVLAALAVRANRPVPLDELADIVWDGCPPTSATATLRNYVKRVRQALGPDTADRIVSQSGGYLIRLDDDESDLTRFEQLCQQAGAALLAGAWTDASVAAAATLELWRGEPLLDVPSQALRDQVVPRLEQLRVQAIEDRIEAELHLDHYERLVPWLRELTARYPLRERFHAQLMRALAHTGRQAEALATYRQAHGVLVTELGVEPGPQLQDLHARILAGDPDFAAPGRLPGEARTTPHQLPTVVGHFIGRVNALKTLSQMADGGGQPGGATVIAVIGGGAGIGKTTLAVHWAHQNMDRFPDGQLYINLRGFDPAGTPLDVTAALRVLLNGLRIPQDRIPVGMAEQCALYRSVLSGHRILIVLDNARSAGQVRPLLPASAGCMVLVTSRHQLLGLAACEGAESLTLDLLSGSEARELLARRLGDGRLDAEPDAATRVIDLCARLPLALNIAAARAGAKPDFPLAVLADQLSHARDRLTALDTGDAAASVRAALSWSYHTLAVPAARMFQLLTVHPGPAITVPTAASLAAVSHLQAREAVAELTQSHLLTEHAPGRYAFDNDLVGVYAKELAHTECPDVERRAALRRVLDHYLYAAHSAAYLLDPDKEWAPPVPPRAGLLPEPHPDVRHALDWLDAEHSVLLAVTARAAEAGFDEHAWQLTLTVANLLGGHRHWHDLADTLALGLEVTRRLGNRDGEALAHRYLGLTLASLAAYRDAYTHLGRALALARQCGDPAGQADAHLGISFALSQQGHHRQALGQARRALAVAEATGDRVAQARTRNATGFYSCLLGYHRQALVSCQQALDLLRTVGSRDGEGAAWHNLGLIHQRLGQHRAAIACFTRALDLFHIAHDRHRQADTLLRLGNSLQNAGESGYAHDTRHQALAILDAIQHPDAQRLRANLSKGSGEIAFTLVETCW